jgi:hypothetical protein
MAMDLFAVLAEVDSTGVLLACCFTELFKDNSRGVRRAESGALTAILEQFYNRFKLLDLIQLFFRTDKDISEISAIRQILPGKTIELCY